MYAISVRLGVSFLVFLLFASATHGVEMFPLEPPDTSSPRATMASFLRYSNALDEAVRAYDENSENSYPMRSSLARLVRCFDLSNVALGIRKEVGVETVLRLHEILSRIPLPDLIDVPGKMEVRGHEIIKWRIPHTEITIGKVAEGSRLGAFLFTPETVDKLDEYYYKVRMLPYKDGAEEGIYEKYIYSSGWLMPDGLIGKLPDWMKQGYMGQAVWQWVGLVLVIVSGGLLLLLILKWNMDLKKRDSTHNGRLIRLIFPVAAIGLCYLVLYIIVTQINITGKVQSVTIVGLEMVFYIIVIWFIILIGSVVRDRILALKEMKDEALDADVIKLICRLVSFGLVFIVLYRAGIHFGISVAGIFASASIAGVAVALAARETLANFFGGISIFLDRPFKAGDYIVLDTGERGEVKAVGMRSTRLQTRDDVLITIPNSVITNVKIVNQSAPRQYFRVRIKIGVAYGSDLEHVEKILLEVAQNNQLVKENPVPRARFRVFGNSSIDYELLVWATRPQYRGRLTHELNKEIYNYFNREGIIIPFPQRDIHIQSGKEEPNVQDSPS